MSYCRFGDDDWTSDVYVYAGNMWETVLSAAHRVWDVELPPPIDLQPDTVDAWVERDHLIMGWLDDPTKCHMVGHPTEEPGDWSHDNPIDCADNLQRLKDLGYHVPDGVIEELRASYGE